MARAYSAPRSVMGAARRWTAVLVWGFGSAAGAQQASSAQQQAESPPPDLRQLTLRQAVDLAQKQGYASRAALATREAARGRDRAFGARMLPQVSLTGTAPKYSSEIKEAPQPNGLSIFTPVQATTANAGLSITQKLPLTGGTFSVTSALQRNELTTGGEQPVLSWASNPVIVSLEQPIFRPNKLRWDSREQAASLDLSERQYLEAREVVALQTTNAYFDFYVAKKSLENASTNAAVNDTLYTLNKGRLEVGKIGENDLLQSELALLRSRSALENAQLEYQRAMAAFRLTLNVAPAAEVDLAVGGEIPQLTPDTAVAVAQALKNRAVISDFELQTIQARHQIADAKLLGGPGATVTASMGFNQTAPDVDLAYQNLLQKKTFEVGVSIPLIQWGARSGDVQAAVANQRRVQANAAASREQVAQDARFSALQLVQATRNVALSAKADTVAQKRFEVAYNRYVIGRIGIDNLYIAQNEKDQAVNQYLQGLRGYWSAFYRLRQVTLFDFERGAPIQ